MATEVIMPQMGFDMKEGTLVKWLKNEGDPVTRGELVAEIETDKAVVEIEAFGAGVLRKRYVAEGTTVPVGQVIAFIGSADEPIPDHPLGASVQTKPSQPQQMTAPTVTAPAAAAPVPAPAPSPATAATPPATSAAPAASAAEERVKASPLARKEAETRGLDLSRLTGTGPGGRITRDDVIAFTQNAAAAGAVPAPQPQGQTGKAGGPDGGPALTGPVVPGPEAQAAPPPIASAPAASPAAQPPARTSSPVSPGGVVKLGDLVPLSRMRQAIARNMVRSKTEIPHFYVTMTVNMSAAVSLREQLNAVQEKASHVSYNDLVIKAAALAILKYPRFNSSFTEKGVQIFPHVNIGMAVALDDGLLAPGIADADKKSVLEIARATKGAAERARTNRLTADEFANATFVVTNLGMYKVDSFSAIITPPLAAALAVGAVTKAPLVESNQVVVRDIMQLTLSVDHRVCDGAQAAVFLSEIRALLESPVRLLL